MSVQVSLRELRQSNSYLDNQLVSVGVDVTDVWTIGIQAFLFKTAGGSLLRVELDAVDFDGSGTAARFSRRGGITYPLNADGGLAVDGSNMPHALALANMKLAQQAQLRGERLEMAKIVMAFQLDIANLAAAVAPDAIASSFDGMAQSTSLVAHAGDAERIGIGASEKAGAAGADGGEQAAQAADEGPWFNPRGLRDNCVGGVCAVVKTSAAGERVTEAEIAAEFGETSRKLTGKSLTLQDAAEYIHESTGRTLSEQAVQLDQKVIEPGQYVVFGGNSTKTLRHVVFATVKSDGRVVIYDPQIGTKWRWFDFVGKYGPGSRAYRLQ